MCTMILVSVLAASSLFFPCTYTTVSSAYICMSHPVHIDGKSLMNMLNKRGPRIEPWGTPTLYARWDDSIFFTLTAWVLCSRYDCIHLRASCEKLNNDNFEIKTL